MAGLHSSDKSGPKFSLPSPTFSKSTSAVSEISQPPSYEDAVKQVSTWSGLYGRVGWLSGRVFTWCGLTRGDSVVERVCHLPAGMSKMSRCSLWGCVVCVQMLPEAERQEVGWTPRCLGFVPAASPTTVGQVFNFSYIKWGRYLLHKDFRWCSIYHIVQTWDRYSNIREELLGQSFLSFFLASKFSDPSKIWMVVEAG